MSNTAPATQIESITIRSATAADDAALARLAQLDSRALPGGRLLIAEVGGSMRAALALDDGAVIADPFHRTRELVELLRTRASVHGRRTRGLRIVARSHPSPARRVAA